MKVSGNEVLITGGSSGIGLALAKALAPNNKVAICGRAQDKLARAQRDVPELQAKLCDLTSRSDREELLRWTMEKLPELNVVINNAGVARKLDLCRDQLDFEAAEEQVITDLLAPIHLTLALLPHLRQPQAALVNVTTGLVYSPDASTPAYSAAKTGLHTWTQAVRYQLQAPQFAFLRYCRRSSTQK